MDCKILFFSDLTFYYSPNNIEAKEMQDLVNTTYMDIIKTIPELQSIEDKDISKILNIEDTKTLMKLLKR